MYEGNIDPTISQFDLDDRSRLDFLKTYRRFITGEVMPLNRVAFEKRVEPKLVAAAGEEAPSKADVRRAMKQDPFFRFYASARRSGQELMYENILDIVDRNPALAASVDAEQASGALRLNPEMPMPRYIDAIDIHCMPGGYARTELPEEQTAGLMYDLASHVYTMGMAGPLNDGFGLGSVGYIQRKFPELALHRIVDLGCGTGACTLPYVRAFPDAEVHGVDVSAPLLKRAFARSEKIGLPVRWSQQNAEQLDFADGSVDLIVSHIMFHETSGRAIRNILKECHRVLRPGGVMAHVDMLSYIDMDPFAIFMFDNETYYNNEPFWANFRSLDQIELAVEAGFDRAAVEIESFDNALARQVQNTGKGTPKTGFQFLFGRR